MKKEIEECADDKQWDIIEEQVNKLVEEAKKHLQRGAWRRALYKLEQADKIAWSPDWL